MGIKDWFRRGKKPGNGDPGAGRAPAQQEKIERMNALFAIGRSIQKWSFKAAGPYLAARHGYDRHISPRILYFDADQAFLDARKLAKEIGDKGKRPRSFTIGPCSSGIRLRRGSVSCPDRLAKSSRK